jgi:hypothetical protein
MLSLRCTISLHVAVGWVRTAGTGRGLARRRSFLCALVELPAEKKTWSTVISTLNKNQSDQKFQEEGKLYIIIWPDQQFADELVHGICAEADVPQVLSVDLQANAAILNDSSCSVHIIWLKTEERREAIWNFKCSELCCKEVQEHTFQLPEGTPLAWTSPTMAPAPVK